MVLQGIKDLPDRPHGSLLAHQLDVRSRVTLRFLETTHLKYYMSKY